MTKSIDVRRVYPHPREKLWRALTESDLLARWLMPNDFRPEVGHHFEFRTDPGPGFDGIVRCEVLEVVELSRLVFTWKGGPVDTVVTFELTDAADGTELHVHQVGFRGLRGRLVGLMLKIGSRDIYGKRLPALLDEMGEGNKPMPRQNPSSACPLRRA